ncbi:Exocyst complex component 6B [Amphibalanus amphitrite]|uniref:Exocyst complex component 6B n=1 Tax=Amphibalanus amphitrite TaxID=1232801 RepID=A0A6A4UVB8_AMPAM|nr:Exocyst complex component 6B [Amphibalanus amphitrite]
MARSSSRKTKKVTKARHDIFIQEIEAMDDYWGSTFRTIYTKEEQEQFMQELDERTREHDKNIERMCNFHYQGFIDSIRELLQSNIHEGIEALKACLPVLETHARLKKQMAEKRFYPALKTLETLESTMLPKVSGHKFAQAAAMSDLKDFLEVVRPRVSAYRRGGHPARGRAVWHRPGGRRSVPPTSGTTLAFLGEEPLAPETLYQTEGDEEDERVAQELVNFSPVYRCQHIFTALGAKDTFRAYYVKQRQKQAGLALQPPAGMHDTLTALHDYLHGVAGFFVVEDHILNTTTDLVTRTGAGPSCGRVLWPS